MEVVNAHPAEHSPDQSKHTFARLKQVMEGSE